MQCQCEPATVILGKMADIEQEIELPFLIGGCRMIDCLLIVYFHLYFWQRHFGPSQNVRVRFPSDFEGVVSIYDGSAVHPYHKIRSVICDPTTRDNECSGVLARSKWSHLTMNFKGRRKDNNAGPTRLIVKGLQMPRSKTNAAFASVLHYTGDRYYVALTLVSFLATLCLWTTPTLVLVVFRLLRYVLARLLTSRWCDRWLLTKVEVKDV